MIFDHIDLILSWAAQCAVVVVLAAGVFYTARYARRRNLPPRRWTATVTTAQNHESDYHTRNYETKPVRGEVAVRLARPKEFLTIGTVKTDDANFEDRLTALVAIAEEKANALNAAEEILR